MESEFYPVSLVADVVHSVGKQGAAYVDHEARQPPHLSHPYHPLQLDTDMIRVICGLDPDVELMRPVTRQSRWGDTRRPHYLDANLGIDLSYLGIIYGGISHAIA